MMKCVTTISVTAAGLSVFVCLGVIPATAGAHENDIFAIGQARVPHVVAIGASLPNDHLAPMWTVSFSLVTHAALRTMGVLLSLLGIVIAWARIDLGVHFPLDMFGAAALALVCSETCANRRRSFAEPMLVWATAAHRTVLSPLLPRGWVRG